MAVIGKSRRREDEREDKVRDVWPGEIGSGVSCRTWVPLDACRTEEAEDTDDAIPRMSTSFSHI